MFTGSARSPPTSAMVSWRRAFGSKAAFETHRAPPTPMSTVTTWPPGATFSPDTTRTSRRARNRWCWRFSGPVTAAILPCPPSPGRRAEKYLALEVKRNAGDHDARAEEQRPLDEEGGLVVEEPLPPVGGDELRQDHRDHLVAAAAVHEVVDVVDQWPDERAIVGVQDPQRHPSPPDLPELLDLLGPLRVEGDMHGLHLVGDRLGVAQGVDRRTVDRRHGDDGGVPDRAIGLDLDQRELGADVEVVPVRPQEAEDHDRDQHHHEPGAVRELGDRDDDQGGAGRRG